MFKNMHKSFTCMAIELREITDKFNFSYTWNHSCAIYLCKKDTCYKWKLFAIFEIFYLKNNKIALVIE